MENRTTSLRARGSLTYLEFIRLVKSLWEESHPDIPILPTGGGEGADYPCILYGMEMRSAHRDDPKPRRFREVLEGEDAKTTVITTSQRFDNYVSFSAITEQDPILAEEIIEAFEDFMLEVTPVLKEMGASELVYSRRYSDTEQDRPGEGIVIRKVAYKLVTEKVTATHHEKLQAIAITARLINKEDNPKPFGTTNLGESPRYYTSGGIAPTFYITPASKDKNMVIIPFTFFRPGDALYIAHGLSGEFPEGIQPGYYQVLNFSGVAYSKMAEYELAPRGTETLVTDYGSNDTPNESGYIYSGKAFYAPDGNVTVNLTE